MWPFKKEDKPSPSVIIDGVVVTYRIEDGWWEYEIAGTRYTCDRTMLDTAVVPKGVAARGWLDEEFESIKVEVRKNLEGWCDWDGDPELIGIEVSDLIESGQIDASFVGDDSWGDLGVNVLLKNGKVTGSYAGD